jgi:hypothetical protein
MSAKMRWTPVLVPYGETGELYLRRAVLLVEDASEDEQKRFYEALLTIPWLAPRVRYAVAKETGRPVHERQSDYEHGQAMALDWLIKERKKRLQGQRPRGGIRGKAFEEVAEEQGMQPETIKKYLQRHKRPK